MLATCEGMLLNDDLKKDIDMYLGLVYLVDMYATCASVG